jgi:hypothetical protein
MSCVAFTLRTATMEHSQQSCYLLSAGADKMTAELFQIFDL